MSVIVHDENIEKLYDEIIENIKSYHPSMNMDSVRKAYDYAYEKHLPQKRKSGEAYIIHPLNVALILSKMRLDKETLIASLLHDVVEDTDTSIEEIGDIFGEEIMFLVQGLTKLREVTSNYEKSELQAVNMKKILWATSKDIRVIIIKLADRLHNMDTLQFQSKEKQKKIARETLDIYVPIAQHLGISVLKNRLEDICLMYLYEEEFKDIGNRMEQFKIDNEASVGYLVDEISKRVTEMGIEFSIEVDYKHLFSIFRKLRKQDIDLRDLYDAYAIRVIVEKKKHCYEVMGLLHDMFVPVPGRFKDFIAMPKNNLYQAIHTTLISKSKNLFEVQIMTKEMRNVAQYGVLTSWRYKEDGDAAGEHEEINQYEKLHWLNELLKWQQDISNAEFLEYVKKDLDVFGKKMVCMTNKGDVVELPKGATAIDFAFFIDEEKGSHIKSVKVNGITSDITKILNNGDIVEVYSSDEVTARSWWLSIVKTQKAKNKLNQILKKDEDLSDGIIPKEKYYRIEDIVIYTENGVGVLFNITGVLQCAGIDILEIHSKVDNEENVFIKLRIRMPVTTNLEEIIDEMCKVEKIREIVVGKGM